MAKVIFPLVMAIFSATTGVAAQRSADFEYIRAERDRFGVMEQVGITYDSHIVTLVRNSNTLCGPSAHVWLGQLERSPVQEDLLFRDTAKQLRVRLPKQRQAGVALQGWRIFDGEVDVSRHQVEAKAIRQMLERYCSAEPDHAGWKSIRSADVWIDKTDDKFSVREHHSKKTEKLSLAKYCKRMGREGDLSSPFLCDVPGFGSVLLSQ